MYKDFKNDEHIRRQRMQEAQQHRLVREASIYAKVQTPRRRTIVKVVLLNITRVVSIVTGA